ncbi:MAG: glycoside hydrolase family 97 N-terminal domain-containing protein, partial [Bacteroidaceae bacterium]|nr:glycoside hydrolase family 97 N-terminal domain-containing protein [Bacteroidaceae bacterium]
MKKEPIIIALFLGLCVSFVSANEQLVLKSPSKKNSIIFSKEGKELKYSVEYNGESIIKEARAGLNIDNWVWEMALGKRDLAQPQCWMDLLNVDSVSYHGQVDKQWQPLYGERSVVKDKYNAATLHMSRHDTSSYRLDVEVRAYDEGVAFRYFFPEHPSAIFHKITEDLTSYNFPAGTIAWSEKWAQGNFYVSPIDSIVQPVERALTLQLPNNGPWVALLDADVDDWCLTKYVADGEASNTLRSVMYSPVDIVTYYATPWKIIMIADEPGQLIENNDIVLNLNPECEIPDTEWIRPGKIMRCTKLTT